MQVVGIEEGIASKGAVLSLDFVIGSPRTYLKSTRKHTGNDRTSSGEYPINFSYLSLLSLTC